MSDKPDKSTQEHYRDRAKVENDELTAELTYHQPDPRIYSEVVRISLTDLMLTVVDSPLSLLHINGDSTMLLEINLNQWPDIVAALDAAGIDGDQLTLQLETDAVRDFSEQVLETLALRRIIPPVDA